MPVLPVALQHTLVRASQDLLVRSNRHPATRRAGFWMYDAMRAVITRSFGRVEGVSAVYLSHSLANGEGYPGLSDFDIVVVFDAADLLAFYDRIRRTWGSLRRYLPISDLSLVAVHEFQVWQDIGGGWDPLDEVRRWRLLAGTEQRRPDVNLVSPAADLDRMQWALGHFQNLVGVAIKEERQSPRMALVARRQLHKCFWNAVLALEASQGDTATFGARVADWMRRHGRPEPVGDLQAMADARFISGPVTKLRFTVVALAFELLDRALATSRLLARPLVRPAVSAGALPPSNLAEVEQRAQAITESVLELLGSNVLSIVLSSTGTSRGYTLYIVMRDGLSRADLAASLRDLRAIHRVFDDPWLNEHFPGGVPVVCSHTMFLARLQTGRSSLHYFETFRRVLHGPDLYAEYTTNGAPAADSAQAVPASQATDWARERLMYSLHLHQIYLGRLKPALYDYVTFYLPRLMLQKQTGSSPATSEEAAAGFACLHTDATVAIPAQMLEQFRHKDLDALLRTMVPTTFQDVWPLLSQGLLSPPHST